MGEQTMLNKDEIVPGYPYIVAGQGPLWLKESVGKTLLFLGHGGGEYWAAPDQVVRRCSTQDVKLYERNKAERNIQPCHDPGCWCRMLS
jgi:hypothetical protein